MSYMKLQARGSRTYLYEYESYREGGVVKKRYIGYHGPVNADAVHLIKADLADPGSDASQLKDAYETGRRVVFVDTETTGFADEDEVWEFFAIKGHYADGGIILGEEFYELAYPSREISPFAAEVTGMTRERLRGNRPSARVAVDFRRFIGKDPCIVGQNVEFDVRMLNNGRRPGGYPDLDQKGAIDILDIARHLHPEADSQKLEAQVRREKVRLTGEYHTARSDTIAAAHLSVVYAKKIRGIERLPMPIE